MKQKEVIVEGLGVLLFDGKLSDDEIQDVLERNRGRLSKRIDDIELMGQLQSENAASNDQLRRIESSNVSPKIRPAARGALGLVASALDAADSVGQLTGLSPRDGSSFLAEGADRLREKSERSFPKIGPQELSGIRGSRDLGMFLQESIAEQLPNLATSIAGGAALKGAGLAANKAAFLASSGTAVPQSVGSIANEIEQRTGESSPLIALGLGSAAGVLEGVFDQAILGRLLSGGTKAARKSAYKDLLEQTFKQAGKEAATEASQESIALVANRLADDTFDMINPENVERVLEATILGGVMGLGLGGGVSLATNSRQQSNIKSALTLPPVDLAQVDAQVRQSQLQALDGTSRISPSRRRNSFLRRNRNLFDRNRIKPTPAIRQTSQPVQAPESEIESEVELADEIAVDPTPSIAEEIALPDESFPTSESLEFFSELDFENDGEKKGLSFDTRIPEITDDPISLVALGKFATLDARDRKSTTPTNTKRHLFVRDRLTDKVVLAPVYTNKGVTFMIGDVDKMQIKGEKLGRINFTKLFRQNLEDGTPRFEPVASIRTPKGTQKTKKTVFTPGEFDAIIRESESRPRELILQAAEDQENGELESRSVSAVGGVLSDGSDGTRGIERRVTSDAPPLPPDLREAILSQIGDRNPSFITEREFQSIVRNAVDIIAESGDLTQSGRFTPVLIEAAKEVSEQEGVSLFEAAQRFSPANPETVAQSLSEFAAQRLFPAFKRGELSQPDGVLGSAPRKEKDTATSGGKGARLNRAQAVSLLGSFQSPLNPEVSANLVKILESEGVKKAAEAIGLTVSIDDIQRASEGQFTPGVQAISLLTTTLDSSVGPHEVAHFFEQFLPEDSRNQIRQDRSNAIRQALQHPGLSENQQEFIRFISNSEISSREFVEMSGGAAELELFYPLINSSEYFAASFSEEFTNRNKSTSKYQAFIQKVKDFFRSILNAIGVPGKGISPVVDRLLKGDFDVNARNGQLFESIPTAEGHLSTEIPALVSAVQNGFPLDVLGSAPRFDTKQDVEDAASRPGLTTDQINEIHSLAGAQSGLVSPDIASQFDAVLGSEDIDPVEKAAINKIRPVIDLAKTDKPVDLKSIADERVRVVAANGVVSQVDRVRKLRSKVKDSLNAARLALTNIIEKESAKASDSSLKVAHLNGVIKSIRSDYQSYLRNRSRISKSAKTFEGIEKQRIVRAARRVAAFKTSPTAIEKAIQSLAEKITPEQLALFENNKQIVEHIASDKLLDGVVGDEVISFLVIGDGNLLPALQKYRNLQSTIKFIHDTRNGSQTVQEAVKEFEDAFRGKDSKRSISVAEFASRYKSLADSRSKAVEAVRQFSRATRSLDFKIQSLTRADEILEQIESSDQFTETFATALDEADVIVEDVVSRGVNGEIIYEAPLSGESIPISFQPLSQHEIENVDNINRLLAEIDAILADPTTRPDIKRTWSKRREFIQRHMIDPGFSTEAGSVRYWDASLLQRAKRIKILGGIHHIRNSIFNMLGGRLAKRLAVNVNARDFLARTLDNLSRDPEKGRARMVVKIIEAAKSHDIDPTEDTLLNVWSRDIGEWILAQNQNSLGLSIGEGDYTPTGHQVTKEDMAAVEAMKQDQEDILNTIQSDEVNNAALRDNQIKIGDDFADRKISRRTFGAGKLTVARRVSSFGREFAAAWNRETAQKRRDLIFEGDGFTRVALGHVVEGNPEYKRNSRHEEAYQKIAVEVKKGEFNPENLDDLIGRISELTQTEGDTSINLADSIESDLLAEIDKSVEGFNSNVLRKKAPSPVKGVPDPLLKILNAEGSFSSPRGAMLAPSSFYTYATTDDGSYFSHRANAKFVLQVRELNLMEDAIAALKAGKERLDAEISNISREKRVTRRSARNTVRARSRKKAQIGDERYDYDQIVRHIEDMEVVKQKAAAVAEDVEKDISGQFGVGREILGLQMTTLLISPPTLIGNVAAGIMGGGAVLDLQGGKGVRSLFGVARNLGKAAKNTLGVVARITKSDKRLQEFIKNNQGPLSNYAEQLLQAQDQYRNDYERAIKSGIIHSEVDYKNRSAAGAILRTEGGRISGAAPTLVRTALDRIVSPELVGNSFDRFKNAVSGAEDINNVTLASDNIAQLDRWKGMAISAFSRRQSSGDPDWNDISKAKNRLTAEELGLPNESFVTRFRELTAPVGSLESIFLDFYDRSKDMTPSERSEAPLINSASDMASLEIELSKVQNAAFDSNRPDFFKGSKGAWMQGVFSFMGFASNLIDQTARATSQPSAGNNEFQKHADSAMTLMVLIGAAVLAGAAANEIKSEAEELFFDRVPNRQRVGNLINNPESGVMLRQAAVSIAAMIPIHGEMLAYFAGGNPSKTITDLAGSSVIASMISNVTGYLRKVVQTGEVPLNTWNMLLGFAPFLKTFNRVSPFEGDEADRSAVRALAAAAPSDIDVKFGSGVRGAVRTTPAAQMVKRMLNSAYKGDMESASKFLEAAIQAKEAEGVADPIRSIEATIASRVPAKRAFGRNITSEEEERIVSAMTGGQREAYQRSQQVFQAISDLVGQEIASVRERAPRQGASIRLSSGSSTGLGGLGFSRRRFGRLGTSRSRRRLGRRRRRLSRLSD